MPEGRGEGVHVAQHGKNKVRGRVSATQIQAHVPWAVYENSLHSVLPVQGQLTRNFTPGANEWVEKRKQCLEFLDLGVFRCRDVSMEREMNICIREFKLGSPFGRLQLLHRQTFVCRHCRRISGVFLCRDVSMKRRMNICIRDFKSGSPLGRLQLLYRQTFVCRHCKHISGVFNVTTYLCETG